MAIDRTSKFAFVERHQKAGKMAAAFLRNLIAALPYRLNIVLTDNGIQFTNHKRHIYAFEHIFDRVCREHRIEHRLTKIKHPWTNGQIERMNCTIKDATVKRFHYDDHDQWRAHLANFISAYNFERRLKTLKGLTPCEVICKHWTIEPERFTLNPIHHMPGLNTAPSRQVLVVNLSGGNQQKLLIAKVMLANPDIVIIDEPTRGIDIGTKQQIYALIHALSRQRKSIIVISSEMQEVIGLADRVLVMRLGQISGQVSGGDMTEDKIVRLAMGLGATKEGAAQWPVVT